MRGIKPPPEWDGDGCTFSPDGFLHHDWQEACRWHDWSYRSDVDTSRWRVDLDFAFNLRECGCHRRWVLWYWIAVRLIGWRFWNKKRTHE